jgi:hypothetical protein
MTLDHFREHFSPFAYITGTSITFPSSTTEEMPKKLKEQL